MSNLYEQPQLLIDGEYLSVDGRDHSPVLNPANNDALGLMPHAASADLDRAIAAAERTFPEWRKESPLIRGRILKKAADLLRERVEHIARQITLEVGKPLAESRIETNLAADTLEWFAEEGRRAFGRMYPSRFRDTRFMTVKEPVGPVFTIAPWNFPIVNSARKIGAALAAGCTIIHKAASEAPTSALAVGRALVDAGLPAGVVAIVFGPSAPLTSHVIAAPGIRKVSFTGSTEVGKLIMKQAVEHGKRTTMELGGHAPVIVFDDVDVDFVLKLSVASKFRNAGQVCVSPTRFFVHEKIFDRFAEGFAQRARELPVGDCLDETNQMGPMAHRRRLESFAALVDDAVKSGAHLMAGGERLPGPGNFYAPTVLANVPDQARIMSVEPFGPVAVINSFNDVEEVIRKANRLPYGLAAYGFSNSVHHVNRLSDALEAGMVGINSYMIAGLPDTPFLGVKESGHGAECGPEGLEACLVTKLVSIS